MFQLQQHENNTQLKNWAKADLLPDGASLSGISAFFSDPNITILTLNDKKTNLPVAVFADISHGLRHNIKPLCWTQDILAGNLKLSAFKSYTKERCYLEALLLLPPSLLEGVRGTIRYRIWVPNNPPLSTQLVRFDLYSNGLWETKLELVKQHHDLWKMMIRTFGFVGTEKSKECASKLKELGFKRISTAFVI